MKGTRATNRQTGLAEIPKPAHAGGAPVWRQTGTSRLRPVYSSHAVIAQSALSKVTSAAFDAAMTQSAFLKFSFAAFEPKTLV